MTLASTIIDQAARAAFGIMPSEFPGLFSADMVRAILNTKPGVWPAEPVDPSKPFKYQTRRLGETWSRRQPGQRVWVKETWAAEARFDRLAPHDLPPGRLWYLADGPKPEWAGKTRVSIHMVRRASRLTLEIVAVRREHLQQITEEDARAEGVAAFPNDPEGDLWTDGKHRTAFHWYWNQLHGWSPPAWDADPPLTPITFKRIT